jgi:hypothetical protein
VPPRPPPRAAPTDGHAGKPAWESFIRRLSTHSPYCAELWQNGDLALPCPQVKTFRNARPAQEIRLTALSRPADEASREAIGQLTYERIPPLTGTGSWWQ